MGADDAWKTLKKMAETFLKSSDEEPSFVVLYSQKTNNTRPETKIKSFGSSNMRKFIENGEVQRMFHKACNKSSEEEEPEKLKGSSNMTKFIEDAEARTKFLKACAKPIEVKEPKKLKNEPQQKCHDLDNKPTLGQGVDELQGYSHCSLRKENRSYADAVKKTLQTSNTTTTNDSTLEVFLTEVSIMRPHGTKPWDAEEVTSPTCRSTKVQTEISIGPATYPDGCVAKEVPGELRTAKPANSLREWSNIKKFWFIQDVSGWASGPVRGLETDRNTIVNTNWIDHISSSSNVFQAMQRPYYVCYDGSSVKDLLRFIRNVSCHYHELPEDVKTGIGRPRAKALDYFTSEFPFLLDHTYKVVKQFAEDVDFASYYKIKTH